MQEIGLSDEEQFIEFKRAKRIREARANVLKMELDCLSPYADRATLMETCKRANSLELGGIVVFPAFAKICAGFLGAERKTALVAALSYPFGGDTTEVKVAAVKRAVRCGVDESEVCAPTAFIKDGNWAYFKKECKKLKRASKVRALRIVFDCSQLSEKEIVRACNIAADVGVDCVRLNGASGELLSTVKTALKGRCRVKADRAENSASFLNFCLMGADAVNCASACDLASLFLKKAETEGSQVVKPPLK